MIAADGPVPGMPKNVAAIRAALEAAGVIFVDENGEGPGVGLKKRKPPEPATDLSEADGQ